MRQYGVLLTAGLLLSGLSSAGAQQTVPMFSRWEPGALPGTPTDTLGSRVGDYRYEGLAFGGLLFGAMGAWIGSRHFGACPLEAGAGCRDDDNHLVEAVTLGLTGAAIGGGLGYLIGRFSPKKTRPDSLHLQSAEPATIPDSIRVVAGYQHWRGAALGLAIGAGVGTLLGTLAPLSCDDCSQPWSRGRAMWTVGLLGAGAGGVVGLLAGLSSPKYVWIRSDGGQQSSP